MPEIARKAEVLPPEQQEYKPTDVSGWKVKIASSWKSAAEGILQVSKDLYEARETLNTKSLKC